MTRLAAIADTRAPRRAFDRGLLRVADQKLSRCKTATPKTLIPGGFRFLRFLRLLRLLRISRRILDLIVHVYSLPSGKATVRVRGIRNILNSGAREV